MKVITTIRGRMDLLFVSFSLLVTVSVGVMFWSINSLKEDALVINLAGRQRMLVQQMTRLAEGIAIVRNQGESGYASGFVVFVVLALVSLGMAYSLKRTNTTQAKAAVDASTIR